ncbi:MAG: hypothetical protein BWX61_01308 [Bacteroidetes bacterium ADurb.Bin035]|nr:MAG: hypothetical protein BWX61_01308 [Bacteroidetes bacterium ADurb.Bin035]
MTSNPLLATHIASPVILAGYAKNKNALVSNAGFRKFIPVPPNTSLPKITAKIVAIASIHNGIVGGTIKAISIPVTKKPSFT